MSFWSFDTGGGGGGAHPDKAAHDLLDIDADTLDTFTAADFVRHVQHTKAIHDALGIDAATLDGIDSADFVQHVQHTKALHDALAIDAATLDGLDALAFALDGHSHAGGGAPTIVVKSVDEPVASSIVLQPDDELKFPIGANEVWRAVWSIFYDAATASDFRCKVVGPAGSRFKFGGFGYDTADTTNPMLITGSVSTEEAGGELWSAGRGAGARTHVLLTGIVVNGATPGDVVLEWAQVTSGATATLVLQDSHVEALRVA